MNALTIATAIPPRLATLCADMEPSRYPDGHTVQRRVVLTDDDRSMAAAALPRAERWLEPATRQRMEDWLAGLNVAVVNPLDAKALAVRCAAIVHALGDLPAAAWCEASGRAAARTLRYFPAVAELTAVLEPFAQDARNTVARLRLIARSAPAAAVDPEVVERRTERAEIEAMTAEDRAKLAAGILAKVGAVFGKGAAA